MINAAGVADLVGKGGHVRTVPIPSWVKSAVDAWTTAAGITDGRVFRAIKAGWIWGNGMSPKVLWDLVRVANSSRSSSSWGMSPSRRRSDTSGCKQKLRCAVNDRLGIEPDAAA